MTETAGIDNPAVAEAYDAWPDAARWQLLELRRLILETAAQTAGVGRVEEALKWGQPSFLTPETRRGSTVRIDALKSNPETVAVYFHCQTGLVDTFRRLYPDTFAYEGNRALHVPVAGKLPEAELKHCVALALTYHQRKGKVSDSAVLTKANL